MFLFDQLKHLTSFCLRFTFHQTVFRNWTLTNNWVKNIVSSSKSTIFHPWSSEINDILVCLDLFFKFRIIGWTCNYFKTRWFIESKSIFQWWNLPFIINSNYRSTFQKSLAVPVLLEHISLNWFPIWILTICYRKIEMKNEFLSNSSTSFSSQCTDINTLSLISSMLTVTDGGKTLLITSFLKILAGI